MSPSLPALAHSHPPPGGGMAPCLYPGRGQRRADPPAGGYGGPGRRGGGDLSGQGMTMEFLGVRQLVVEGHRVCAGGVCGEVLGWRF